MTKTEHVFKGTWKGTRAEYEAIASPDPDILYCITDEPPASTAYVDAGLALKQDISGMSAYATQTDLQQGLATREPLLSDAQHAAVNSGITASILSGFGQIYEAWGIINGTDSNVITGKIQYVRTGVKKGLLSMAIFVKANSQASNFDYMSLATIGSIIGVSLKNPTSLRESGTWAVVDNVDGYQYGTSVQILTTGSMRLGRYYNESGSFGGWPLSYIGGTNGYRILIHNVFVEEN